MKHIILFFILSIAQLVLAAQPSATLPVLYIQTQNSTPITSKDYYLQATYYLDAKALTGYETIGSAQQPLSMEIKGRGNYTWRDFDKKPYRIKLADKQPLLGMNKSKHFALLAHADDALNRKGFMRNQVGFFLSKMIGMDFTPNVKPLELVLNGEYIGLYFLTETIQVDHDRVNILEQADQAIDPSDITGGWLVEIDNYNEDPHITILENENYTMWVTYKTPELLSNAQEQFLIQEMQRLDGLIYGDKNSAELWQYLDMDALAKFYIVQEIMDNYEAFHGSCYLYREKGEGQKWKFGPVWDFGSAINRDKSQYIFEGQVWHNHWIPEICKFPAFMQHVKQLWQNVYPQLPEVYTFTAQQLSILQAAATADANRWTQYSGNKDLAKRITEVNQWLKQSIQWLNKQWGNGESGGNEGDYTGNNPEYDPTTTSTHYMHVWYNGIPVEYNIAQVDSVTFLEKEDKIVVKAKVPKSWNETIYVWIWGDDVDENEHIAMRQGEWMVFVHEGKELNIIFKQGKGWQGHPYQTEDIYTTRSACYLLTQQGEDKAQATEVDCPEP